MLKRTAKFANVMAMGSDVASWPSLLAATIALRPYVFFFLAAFLVLAGRDLGWRRGAGWLAWGFVVALTAEYASTRFGIPFGLYHYTGATAGRELFISNVPFFDPLSFPFLAYASFSLARGALGKPDGWAVSALAGTLMMLLDVVIDPLAVRGGRWFLGRVFYYAEPGVFFGVPVSNFVGWVLVGCAIVAGYLWAVGPPSRPMGSPSGGIGLYYGVLGFNLGLAGWIGEWHLLGVGILVHVAVILVLYPLKTMSAAWDRAAALRQEARGAAATTVTDGGLLTD